MIEARRNSRIRTWALSAAVTWLVLGLLIAAGIFAFGCQPVDVAATKARLDTAIAQAHEAEAKAKDAEAAAIAANNEKAAAEARATAALASEWAAKLAEAQASLASATTPSGEITPESAIGAVAPFLPPPWNLALGIGGTLLAGLVQEWRVRQREQAARSIVDGIEEAKANDPAFKAALARNKGTLLASYTDRAFNMVEEAIPAKPTN